MAEDPSGPVSPGASPARALGEGRTCAGPDPPGPSPGCTAALGALGRGGRQRALRPGSSARGSGLGDETEPDNGYRGSAIAAGDACP